MAEIKTLVEAKYRIAAAAAVFLFPNFQGF
jgi:hypothetical protein